MDAQQLVPVPGPEARQWAMFCHYAAFFWFLVPMVGNVIGPLIVWQLKKDSAPFVDDQGKEALNFQITFSLAMMICGVLAWIIVGFALIPLVKVAALVMTIIAGIKANAGEAYRYPICWRVVK